MGAVQTEGVVEMMMMMTMMIHSCRNARLIVAVWTGANAAKETAGICVKSLFWDLVGATEQDVLQAGTIQEETALCNVMSVKQ